MTKSDAFLSTAKRVIAQEAEALGLLSDSLGEEFTKAIETVLSAKGRTIVTGMGKSGHIARKIAATLASTGTPAYFVHPAEASHGDLGMIGDGDICLVLSNSGETPELADLIAYTRRFKIPMIGVASNPDSTLIRACDVALILPKAPEACGHGIVPTTSTTMTLALGDALAIALMEHRAFTADHFRVLHPGGKLGSRLTKVRDLMHSDMPLVPTDTPMREALSVVSAKGFGVVGVVDAEGHLRGIITDGDLRRHIDGLLEKTAGDIMTADPLTISPDALAEKAVARMDERAITCLFVRDPAEDGRPCGILKIQDCLRAGVV
ncbi:KpsF/GutQ family sugar-phosphate isomerase [Celeribacter halophilus]|jgi:arabinose-5-phosphate isomerase|uniref:KpsF/GutQ family sugar-phosphate isomerase n=1 Tax=Celeribacter halophilus TaxID=576117 RepID=A0AAW7XRM7_9RHOB|nr:KpsF/GutQ family sugar-phosphate isomerase [Celeribacter halophilus]MBU2889624.1 KpsF/GutQ family sugar-phosphate isomerase [Celeribacter halophilus]MDO6456914.1 KpsF/GutQ family sugar-phosphate isomerase [Celeribacter halophilus]MDO6510734.1 KpsF/GutQ family sugar-phosphate isomerase [Celeribacter halophilus]MDO6723576.1 KpsF/GutQ family sugar-phosphate isomerase [Celeribacter halophilus]